MPRLFKYQLKKEMQQAFPAPPPQGKEEFLRGFPYPKAKRIEMVGVQVSYIRKWTWALSLLAVALALLAGRNFGQESSGFWMLSCLSAAMPVLAVLAVTETFRSSVYGMAELEIAAKYNLPQVLLVRMGILGGADILLMLLGVPWIVQEGGFSSLRAAVYLLVPWVGTCAIAFQIEKYVKGREGIWCCAAFAMFLCAPSLAGRQFWQQIYGHGTFYLWLAALVVFAAAMGNQVWRICCASKGLEEWKWNLFLTV